MNLLYKKPSLRSYSAEGISENLGPVETQYAQFTLQAIEFEVSSNTQNSLEIIQLVRKNNEVVKFEKLM